jgi:hypothetical protein
MSGETRSTSVRARHCLMAVCLGLALFFAVDALLFRTTLYSSIIQPDSSAGVFESVLRRELAAQKKHGDNLVATLGDSRFGYSLKQAAELAAGGGYWLRQAGVAGTCPRDWYYMLRDLDPQANRYRALVFGMNDYRDEDEYYNPNEDLRTLHYAIARLRLGDVWDLTSTYEGAKLKLAAFRGSLFKGVEYQPDIFEFLGNPHKRISYVKLCNRGYAGWTYDYEESQRTMTGLKIDWDQWTVQFPGGADQNQRDTVVNAVMRQPAPQAGHLAAFRRFWFGKILDRYRNSRTKIIFLRLPRGPIVRPDRLARPAGSVVREFARTRPNVAIADEHAFDSLEAPEFFKDGLHLNRQGLTRFAPLLEAEVTRLLNAMPGAGTQEAAHAF